MGTHYNIWINEDGKRKKLVAILESFEEVKEYLLCTSTSLCNIEVYEYRGAILIHQYTISDFIFHQKNVK